MGAASAAALDLHGGITTALCGSAAAAIPMACKFRSLPAAALLNEEGQCVGTQKKKRPVARLTGRFKGYIELNNQ
ncbi:hypothetical protein QL772_004701 [Escherichia coli]|nr:hypothetical protein [Escherichia coli]